MPEHGGAAPRSDPRRARGNHHRRLTGSALPEVPGAARIAEAADEAPNQPAEIVPTLEQSRAASEAESIVQRATVAGRWTDEDSHRLDDQLRRMAPEDAENLRKEVIAALNRGELEIAFSGRPAF